MSSDTANGKAFARIETDTRVNAFTDIGLPHHRSAVKTQCERRHAAIACLVAASLAVDDIRSAHVVVAEVAPAIHLSIAPRPIEAVLEEYRADFDRTNVTQSALWARETALIYGGGARFSGYAVDSRATQAGQHRAVMGDCRVATALAPKYAIQRARNADTIRLGGEDG